ncbi:MAG TPA: alpha-amylase [Thiotrichales bacterium]|nr:alpha-amylase [Thiotrichales bacterium]
MNGSRESVTERIHHRLARLYGTPRSGRLCRRLELLAGRYREDLPTLAGEPCWDQRTSVLIAYGDIVRSDGEPPLETLHRFLDERVGEAIRHLHLLPFFPSSSDEGFSVIDFRRVDPALGEWRQVESLARRWPLLVDLVLNHASSQSEWFHHFCAGVAPYRDYFITVDPEQWDLSQVVRPRSSPLLTPATTPWGVRQVWTTFSADQVDLNFANPDVLFEFLDILLLYILHGARIIRLDAIAYLWKRSGTPCIHLPETHQVVKLLRDVVDWLAPGTLILTETNVPHAENVSYFGKGDEAHLIYQFSLPPLLLHALLRGDASHLIHWLEHLEAPPPGCSYLNFTASHDGIGVRPLEGLLPEEELEWLVEQIHRRGGLVSHYQAPDGSLRPYELNISWFEAMGDGSTPANGEQIARHLCAQTLMLSLQGVPALWFHLLTATPNDREAVERTGQARSINRHRWDLVHLEELLEHHEATRSVFDGLLQRLRIRAAEPLFSPEVPQRIERIDSRIVALVREREGERLLVLANLSGERLEAALPDSLGGRWRDLLQPECRTEDEAAVPLAPWQVRWLREDADAGGRCPPPR